MSYFATNSIFRKRGFTLVELLVTVTIIALITAITVFNQNDYSDRLALTKAASDIELQIREMQQYGVSVRESSTNSGKFDYAYGITINLNSAVTGTMGQYNLWSFVDINNSTRYNPPSGWATCPNNSTSECVATTSLKYNVKIIDLCAINSSGGQNCKSNGGSGVPGRIDVTFKRPNLGAIFAFNNTSGNPVAFPNHRGAKIRIQSPRGKTMDIYIYTTGQVSVQ